MGAFALWVTLQNFVAKNLTEWFKSLNGELLGIQCRRIEVARPTKGAKAGDIDLLVETEQFIGLFEIKKKGLTRKTNSGDELQMLVDLVRGLIHGVNQLTKHELTLRRTGELKLIDGTVLSLGTRDIFKGVISLSDYGGLHDGSILLNTLLTFCQVTLNSDRKGMRTITWTTWR
ncbi:hypothetical protein SAMN04515620_1677 [Collimonas sp. OK607]|uniref:hypothetical protein n=1 Tax=Collimonas sp. OK607 TaxID=1798194 RepID=UPI0008EC1D91|nr:hypothetical protein [Collimonas sp. OK607]SFB40167.1 hypothetical protein SAMN04515620_1677 [Collimonas sp. OK607]